MKSTQRLSTSVGKSANNMSAQLHTIGEEEEETESPGIDSKFGKIITVDAASGVNLSESKKDVVGQITRN